MTIGTFLDTCTNQDSIITVIKSGVGRIYSGHIETLRKDESEFGAKLVSKKIEKFFIDINTHNMALEILITI